MKQRTRKKSIREKIQNDEGAYSIIVLVKVLGDHRFMPCKRFFEVSERIA